MRVLGIMELLIYKKGGDGQFLFSLRGMWFSFVGSWIGIIFRGLRPVFLLQSCLGWFKDRQQVVAYAFVRDVGALHSGGSHFWFKIICTYKM